MTSKVSRGQRQHWQDLTCNLVLSMLLMPVIRTHKTVQSPHPFSQPKNYPRIQQRGNCLIHGDFFQCHTNLACCFVTHCDMILKSQQALYHDSTKKQLLFCICKLSLKNGQLFCLTGHQRSDLHISACKQYKNRPCHHHRAMLYAFSGALNYAYIDTVRVHI